jgi:hypothetical protein
MMSYSAIPVRGRLADVITLKAGVPYRYHALTFFAKPYADLGQCDIAGRAGKVGLVVVREEVAVKKVGSPASKSDWRKLPKS